VLASPKTSSSLRDVPMPRFVRRAVRAHADELGLAGSAVLCRTSRGTLLRRDYCNRNIWKPAIAAAGLAEDTTFHDLRHTFASTALAKVCRSRRSHAGWAIGPSPPLSTSTGTSYPRRAAGLGTPWTKLSAGSPCAPASVTARFAARQMRSRWVSRPVGRVLCARLRGAAVIHLGLPLPAASCGLPASIGRAALDRSRREPLAPLLTLLRVGFTEPPQSPAALVVSYTTVSPLPRLTPGRSAFCGTVPRVTPGRRYRPPCPVEPGPSSPGLRPARPPGRLTRA
jgi:hypothetical protein